MTSITWAQFWSYYKEVKIYINKCENRLNSTTRMQRIQ